ncbi:hypothetical protein [Natronomonas gomsonensis]|jgi:prophage maintenance system killer protein|uniref:hypothetical protein n=1 Tax=Natronomonas gomsonensis TaxID=1046043 RepID=UPI0015B7A491|nr:hypothetical protein [Natronomonas gomsonensis]
MSTTVYYHHPEDSRLSIDYVTHDFEAAEDRTGGSERDIYQIEEYDLNGTVYVVYHGTIVPKVADDVDLDIYESVADMEWANQIITTRILRLLESVIEEKYEEENEKLAAYKDIEVKKIPEALDRVHWGDSVTETAGELVSCLILRHSLPNANHRTSLAMLSLYYQAISPQFDMPATATEEYDWEGWVNDYIEESKEIITVRRNTIRFHYLNEYGCNVVERKDGLRIHLNEYDLDMHPRKALEHYAEYHTKRSVAFAETVLKQAGTKELRNGAPLDKVEFAERLQEMD